MTTRDVANRLVALCREGQNHLAIRELYADDIVSIEAAGPAQELHGIEAIRDKNDAWVGQHDVHAQKVEGPFVNGDQFAVRFTYDITVKATGVRTVMDEVALYVVEGGKIVHETFLY